MSPDQASAVVTLLRLIAVELGLLVAIICAWIFFEEGRR